jgi:hypothetical protein
MYQVATSSNPCAQNQNFSDWTLVGTSTQLFQLSSSANFSDGDATTNQLGGTGTFKAGKINKTSNPDSLIARAISPAGPTEDEWNMQAQSTASAGTQYAFMEWMYVGNAKLDVTTTGYPVCPLLTVASPASVVYNFFSVAAQQFIVYFNQNFVIY